MSQISPVPQINAWVDGTIGWLEFDRPEAKNAINADMWRAIPHIMSQLNSDNAVRVIIVRGSGMDAFSAGADISEFGANRSSPESAKDYEQINVDAFKAVSGSAKPTLAMINGFCMGGGLAIALSCDLRIAADNAIFALPPAKLGLAYPIEGIAQLLSVVSPPVAKDMLFTARRLNALQASRAGLVNDVTALAELEEVVRQTAKTISENAPLTIAASKLMINELHANPQNPDIDKLTKASQKCFASKDYAEGQKAFAEKRKPVFTGE